MRPVSLEIKGRSTYCCSYRQRPPWQTDLERQRDTSPGRHDCHRQFSIEQEQWPTNPQRHCCEPGPPAASCCSYNWCPCYVSTGSGNSCTYSCPASLVESSSSMMAQQLCQMLSSHRCLSWPGRARNVFHASTHGSASQHGTGCITNTSSQRKWGRWGSSAAAISATQWDANVSALAQCVSLPTAIWWLGRLAWSISILCTESYARAFHGSGDGSRSTWLGSQVPQPLTNVVTGPEVTMPTTSGSGSVEDTTYHPPLSQP
ncbi:TPA: hypothetical protein ACH3X2_012039 [Trebouxia sp. C0005]